jgi:hypothetical protein
MEHLRQCNIGNKHWLGKKHNQDSIEKMRLTKIGKKMEFTDEHREFLAESMRKKTSKSVAQYDLNGTFITEYESATAAGLILGISAHGICSCRCGRQKTASGYIWRYK